eukprot:CAMPEP_0204132680 /NCGR_PEP_ID=MMETSP0361-20130328/14668_1 /ASSEMBLY_ACC=CAM_ASM_000343 /TAXON_ID=268821 /ORGANISM="Scrippsiella Hangoei, Strain SHTV-5" /LENGTH=38 /DNA_ID= /DNA_START= /DNA_END= /DNA_ORIENTATION=
MALQHRAMLHAGKTPEFESHDNCYGVAGIPKMSCMSQS